MSRIFSASHAFTRPGGVPPWSVDTRRRSPAGGRVEGVLRFAELGSSLLGRPLDAENHADEASSSQNSDDDGHDPAHDVVLVGRENNSRQEGRDQNFSRPRTADAEHGKSAPLAGWEEDLEAVPMICMRVPSLRTPPGPCQQRFHPGRTAPAKQHRRTAPAGSTGEQHGGRLALGTAA